MKPAKWRMKMTQAQKAKFQELVNIAKKEYEKLNAEQKQLFIKNKPYNAAILKIIYA